MRKPTIRHDNLRRVLAEIYLINDEIPYESIKTLMEELKHSNLIVAGDAYENGIDLFYITYKKGRYGLLFTDMDEFRKVFPNDKVESHYYPFEYYRGMHDALDMEGFILNIASECLPITEPAFNLIRGEPKFEIGTDDAYTPHELKELKDSIDNSELEEFIENPDNIGKYEDLFEKISASTMLTLMLSPYDFRDIADDGVVPTFDEGPVGFLYIEEVGGNYATVYTSEAKISNIRTGLNKYSQIVDFSILTNFILNDDMDGILINPNSDNVLLTREVLLEYAPLLQNTCNDSRLSNAMFNMFVIEEEEYEQKSY